MTQNRTVVRSTCRWTEEAVELFATLLDWRSFPGQLLVVALVVVSGVAFYFISAEQVAGLSS
jgi:hypothetical protein